MILIKPEQCIGDQEISHLITAAIEYQGIPILLYTLPRISMFIEMGSVEGLEGKRVLWKMGRDPVKDNTQSCGVAAVHEVHQVVWCTEPGGRGIVTGDLIAPGAVKRVFGQGEELDVIEPHLLHIGDELFGCFPISQPPVALLDPAPPGTQMDFINCHGSAQRVLLRPRGHPFVVSPGIGIQIMDNSGSFRSLFKAKRKRIGLDEENSVLGAYFKFVKETWPQVGHE